MRAAGILLLCLQAAISMRTLDRGTQSNIDQARQVVIRTADEWSALWRAHAAEKPAPAVDFTKEMVVGVFLGSRPTAGYSVEIVGTKEQPDGLVVVYHQGSPARDMMTAQVITTPYHLVAVPKRAGKVEFEKVRSQK
jgi:PrcB C-terminal